MIDGLVEMTIDIGIDVTWNYTLDSNDGVKPILLPVGDFQISSEFTTIQHERILMNYTGNSFGLIEQGIIDVELSYTRTLNSKSNLTINDASVVNATFIESLQC